MSISCEEGVSKVKFWMEPSLISCVVSSKLLKQMLNKAREKNTQSNGVVVVIKYGNI